jgi:hypothetical protein
MKKIKSINDFEPINEAVRQPIVGHVYKVMWNERMGKYSDHHEGKSDWKYGHMQPDRIVNSDDGAFYFKVTKGEGSWITGTVLAANCIFGSTSNRSKTKTRTSRGSRGYRHKESYTIDLSSNDRFDLTMYNAPYAIRMNKGDLVEPGPEWKYMEEAKIGDIIGKKFFIDGTECKYYNEESNEFKPDEAEYIAWGVNFGLTKQYEDAVIWLRPKVDNVGSPVVFVKASDLSGSVLKEITDDQRKIIADWFSVRLGSDEIEVQGENFRIYTFKIETSKKNGFPSNFNAGPFINKKQAEEIVDAINKINTHSLFDVGEIKIERCEGYNRLKFDLDGLIKWCKSVGIETTVRELLQKRKGQTNMRKFGV